MADNKTRYKKMEFMMTCALGADALFFVLYLLFAGLGIVWLKVVLAILAILLSGACLYFLYITHELLHQRSLWMSASAAAIALCILVSLVLNFPSPNPYKKDVTGQASPSSTYVWTADKL